MAESQEPLTSQGVANAVSGLRYLGDSPETLALLAALTPKVAQCRGELSAVGVVSVVRPGNPLRQSLLEEGRKRVYARKETSGSQPGYQQLLVA